LSTPTIITAIRLSFYLILTCLVHLHMLHIWIFRCAKIPSETRHKYYNEFHFQHKQSPLNTYSKFTPSPQNSTSTSSSIPIAHVIFWLKHFFTINRFRNFRATFDTLWLYFVIFVLKKVQDDQNHCAPHYSILTTWLNLTAWQLNARTKETLNSH
jgi:hypothetical protein